jgi:hypothetical protein
LIVIRVELWKKGSSANCQEIGRAYLWNTGVTQDGKRGNYQIRVARRGEHDPQTVLSLGKFTRAGALLNFPRLSYNVWRLVIRALLEAFPEENNAVPKEAVGTHVAQQKSEIPPS